MSRPTVGPKKIILPRPVYASRSDRGEPGSPQIGLSFVGWPRVGRSFGRTYFETKIFKRVAYFSAPENHHPEHHVHHANHHDHTTKKPPSKHHFFQNTPQNSSKKSKAPALTGALLFFLKQLLSTCRPYRRRHGCVRRPQLPSSPEYRRSSPRWSASIQRSKPHSAEQYA
jgi:hypothetical protein